MEALIFNGHTYYIYNVDKIQKLKNGTEFKFVQSYKILTKPSKWIDKMERHHWLHEFREIESKKLFVIEVNYYDQPLTAYYLK